jgi:hypothetical protein
MPVEDLGDVDGWTAQPVDHDPFAVPDSSSPETSGKTAPVSGLTPFGETLAPMPQGLGALYDPSAQMTVFHKGLSGRPAYCSTSGTGLNLAARQDAGCSDEESLWRA